jgi:hypothetical protein
VPAPAAAGELFVRAEPSTRRVVPGQQIVVDYVLYAEPHLRPRRSQVVGPWNAEGFWREELDVPAYTTYPRPVTVGGKSYEAVTIRRLALFPTRTGSLEVGEMRFEIEVARGPFDSLPGWFSRDDVEEVAAPALTLTADPLPGTAPASFSGAVGQFGMAAFVENDRVATGEPVRLTVEISGTGNVATLAAPTVEVPDGFDRFDPDQDRQIDRGTTPLRGTRTFTYTLVPRGGGRFEIPPIAWSYYDPEARQYRTLRSAAFPITVTGAAGPAVTAVPEAEALDPRVPLGLMTEVSWRPRTPAVRVSAALLIGGLGLPLLALLGLLAVRRHAARRTDDSPEARALRAHPEARRRLTEARAALDDTRAFYAAIERALRAFLAERLVFPAQGLSRAALNDALAARGLSVETRAEVDRLLAIAERAQFAPGSTDDRASREADADRAARLFAAVDAEAYAEASAVA